MSRRSLRLDEGLLDRSLPRSGTSYRVGGAGWRSSRPRHSQHHSASCSESLLAASPCKTGGQPFLDSSLHSLASDASLISSLLEESSIQQSTLVETFWGLDQDEDPKESTVIAGESSALIGPDSGRAKPPAPGLSRVCCQDCSCPSSPEIATETSTVYCRERGRRGRTGWLAGDVFRWISSRWNQLSSGFHPSRLLVGLLLLLLFCLFWFRPSGFYLLPPGFNMADAPGLSSVPMSSQTPPAEGSTEDELQSPPPSVENPPQQEAAPPAAEPLDAERLVRMEQSLQALWEEMEAAGRRAEQSHRELLRLYTDLGQRGGADVERWISGLMEQQLSLLRRRLSEERRQREEMRQQDLLVLKSQRSRLDQLELQLQQVSAGSRDFPHDTAPPTALPAAPSTANMDQQSQDALQADVSRLEAAPTVRQDVEGLSGCRGGCIHQTTSEQVSVLIREEVRSLIYGNQLTQGGDSVLPESLLQWLSQQFVREADLQEALSSLEFSILQNIRGRRQGEEEAGSAVTKEELHQMVTEALRRFSQDRTGLADYALESGGGSILSTRCSETYETKAALLSLFGVPLWYFSQSPRVVIQPDVHPGNCWAFRGSKGFLVIQLSMRILPTAVTMEHIPKSLAPSRTLRSAPRDFSVYGLTNERQERGKLLGNYTYDEDGEDLQTFPISEENDETFQIIEVQVLSNWGHPEYTCMYRFRVHGTPSDA